MAEHAGLDHQAERGQRVLRREQLGHLGLDALAREAAQPGRGGGTGGERRGIGRRPAVVGEEAEEAQDAQIVLGDARRGVADEAHPARREIGPAAEIVVEPARSDRSSWH